MEENEKIIEEIPKPKEKNRKKSTIKTLLLVLFFCATFYCVYLISKDLSGSSVATFKFVIANINLRNLLFLLLLVAILFFTDALKYSIIAKIIKGKFDYALCINIGIMGRFYDNITPFNTGGQAYQVYQLYNKGYTPSEATAIPIVKYIFQLLAWICVSIVLYIVNHQALDYLPLARANGIKIACYVGISIACLAPTLVILFSVFPKTVLKIIGFFMKLFYKMKIIKDYDTKIAKVTSFLDQYKEAFIKINKNVVGIISLFILSMIDFILIMSIPYFVLLSIGNASYSFKLFFDVITLNAYSLFAASLVPTPGNSGAIEAVYSMVFAPIPMSQGLLFWVVFTWRFYSYYIYLFIGFIETIILFISHKFKKKKQYPKIN
ncbi:MAG: lysylphosphatidylglycerol synthase transmembrane domain-containing protein [Clostridia bacterium]